MGLILSVVTLAVMIVGYIGVYYAISYAVLWLVGKTLPLTGRRRT